MRYIFNFLSCLCGSEQQASYWQLWQPFLSCLCGSEQTLRLFD
ncbi:hypothetical protein BMY_0076 [Wohlfahrtiimonas chitiniclastica]|nr:hypothetical protein BMY_0076 [Wohlfahrtiimonas chitiniclastica]